MKIQCKECGVFFTVDQQDAAEHIGICDRCLSAAPKKAEYQADQFQIKETRAQKAARQKRELEEAKLAEEAKAAEAVKTADADQEPKENVGTDASILPSGDQGVKTGEGDPVETTSEVTPPVSE